MKPTKSTTLEAENASKLGPGLPNCRQNSNPNLVWCILVSQKRMTPNVALA